MSDQMGETRSFAFPTDTPDSAKEVIQYVYEALKAKGHDPIMQLVGTSSPEIRRISPATTTPVP